MKWNTSSPVIIIGMHRSGTTLLTRLLEKMGVFWGSVKDEYNESVCFQLLNEQMMRQVHCKWDDMTALVSLEEDNIRNRRLHDIITTVVDDNFFRIYCGVSLTSREKRNSSRSLVWGFKDPKTTFTLPFWLKHYPEAKIIHIVRNGIDVAASLWRRETSRPEGVLHPHYSSMCQNLDGCFDVWSCYVNRSLSYSESKLDIHELFFEDLLANPDETLMSLAEYLGIPKVYSVDEVSSIIDRDRGYGYRNDPELFNFTLQKEADPLLHKLYHNRTKRNCAENVGVDS